MWTPEPLRGRVLRPRRLAIACGLVALAAAAMLSATVWFRGTLQARVYSARIRDALAGWERSRSDRPRNSTAISEWRKEDADVWRIAEANLHALALEGRSACADALAHWVCERRLGSLSTRAMRLLRRRYPQHPVVLGARKYRQIVSAWGFWPTWDWDRSTIHGLEVDDERAGRLRRWLESFPGHPASDDALLRWAGAELAAGRSLIAVQLLHRALHAPDGDRFMRAHVNLRWVLDRDCDAAQLVGWLHHGCPDHLRPLATYFAAVHSLREKTYAEAVELFERFLATPGGALREELGIWHESCYAPTTPRRHCFSTEQVDASARASAAKVFAWATEQLELAQRLAELAESHRLASDDESRAGALYKLARACFERPRSFRNVFVNPRYGARAWHAVADETPEACVAALPLDLGYRHAADFFQRLVAEYPGSEFVPRAAFSVPLCLWRTKVLVGERAGRGVSSSFDLAIARSFQAFADRYPRSSMADEALYSAGVHFYCAGQSHGEQARILLNAARIARDYPDGNIARDYREKNGFLRRALEAVSQAERPTGAVGGGQ